MLLATLLRALVVYVAFYGQSMVPLVGLLAGTFVHEWAERLGHPWYWIRYWTVEGVFATSVYVLLEKYSQQACPATDTTTTPWCDIVHMGAFYRCATAAWAATFVCTRLE